MCTYMKSEQQCFINLQNMLNYVEHVTNFHMNDA